MSEPVGRGSWRSNLKNPAIWAIVVLFLVYTASYADRAVLAVLQEDIKADLHLTDTQLGLLAGPVFALLYGFAGIPLARLAERTNRKRIVLTGVFLWSSFTALCGLATNFFTLAFLRMGVGAAEAAAPPAAQSLVADYFSRKARARAMSILALGVPIGVMVGGTGGGIIAGYIDWRWTFAAIGLPGLLICFLGMKFIFEAPRRPDVKNADLTPLSFWDATKVLLKNPVFVLLLAGAFFTGNAAHATSSFAASFYIRAHELDMATVGGTILLAKGLVGMVGTLAGGMLSDKVDSGKGHDYIMVPALGSLFCGSLYAASLYVENTWLSMAVWSTGSFFGGWIVGTTMAAVQNVVDLRTRATGAALFMFFITVPGSIGPVMVGMISDVVASGSMGLSAAQYAATCPGGKVAEGISAFTQSDCSTSSVMGLTRGVTAGAFLYYGCAILYAASAIVARKMSNRDDDLPKSDLVVDDGTPANNKISG